MLVDQKGWFSFLFLDHAYLNRKNKNLSAYWHSWPFLLPWYLFLQRNVHVSDKNTSLLIQSGSRLWVYSQHFLMGEKTSGSRLWGSKDDSWSYQGRLYISGFFESRLLHTPHISHCASLCYECDCPRMDVLLKTYFRNSFLTVAKFIVPDVGDKVNSGVGLSYRPARLRRLAGRYDNPMPESAIFHSQGLWIHSRKSVANGLNNNKSRRHLL